MGQTSAFHPKPTSEKAVLQLLAWDNWFASFCLGGAISKHKPLLTFTPAELRPRRDGWTADKQIAFVEKLADCGSIGAACKYVGMSSESVRKLRRHPCGREFRDAMDAALDCSYADLEQAAMERAKKVVARPVFFHGEQVGEWRHYDERLTMLLLRFRRRHRFGPEADTLPPPPVGIPGIDPNAQLPFDPEGALEGCLVGIGMAPEIDPEEEQPCLEGESQSE